ncbi:MAG TPA: glycosyltransferase, partial [Planctomycetota bacterium]|nr:glycosyltransferase [Planctomycetota bacterium]
MTSDQDARDANRRIYETRYTARNYDPAKADDVFAAMFADKLQAVRSVAGPGARTLDLGCGAGDFLRPLASEGRDVVGVDFSGPILDELRAAFARDGGDPSALRLHRADARAVPEPDASFDVVFAFAVLYTVPAPEEVFSEVARLLKPGGVALLDLGLERSLNAIEARRTSTGVRTWHLRFGPTLRRLAAAGLAPAADRAYQLFPCWGGGTPRAAALLNPLLARRLATRRSDGRTLDEAIASSPALKPFAFRRLILVERTDPATAEARRRAFVARERRDALAAATASQEGAARRDAARRAAERGAVADAAARYADALAFDASDVEAALGLASLYDGAEERARVERWKRLARRARAAFAGTATAPVDVRVPSAPRRRAPPSKGAAPKAPRVTVVLPTYDQAAFLPRSVESVLAQTYADFELVIVDDGSTDGTAAWLATVKDPRVRTLRQANARLPRALNAGFAAARGELLTWTSSDNVCAPTFLETLVAALDARPDAGLAVGGFAWIDANDRVTRVTRGQDVSPAALLCRNPGNAAFLYRRCVAEAIGAYDPDLEGAEDWDYWIRLSERAPAIAVDAVVY